VGVAIKIEHKATNLLKCVFGRHFEENDELVSKISRSSIDALKENFRDDLTKDEWKLVVRLKHLFNVQ